MKGSAEGLGLFKTVNNKLCRRRLRHIFGSI
jgi:hypothetical protein